MVLLPSFLFGQFVVEDPAVAELMANLNIMITENQVQNSAEFAQQTTTLKNTLDFMKETNEKLKKINEKLQNVIYYTDLVKKQLQILQAQMEYIASLKKDGHITAEEIKTVNDIFGELLKKSEQLLDIASNTLKDDVYNMSDFERIQLIKDINEQMSDILCEVMTTERNFYYLKRDRELEGFFKNW
jgi:hypothetical protein